MQASQQATAATLRSSCFATAFLLLEQTAAAAVAAAILLLEQSTAAAVATATTLQQASLNLASIKHQTSAQHEGKAGDARNKNTIHGKPPDR
jgi:hypothetical protein